MQFKIKHNIHSGHRNRAIKKLKKFDGCDADDKEILEALLFNAFANGDVSQTAYALIERFGTLQRVLEANEKDLLRVDGIGESVVQTITINRICMRRVLEESVSKGDVMNTSVVFREFCEGLFMFSKSEEVRILLLDDEYGYIAQRKVCDGSIESSKLNLMLISRYVTDMKASVVVLAHNHPKASVLPSDEDRLTTRTIYNMLERIGVYLADHIIVGVGGSLSMREQDFIPDIWMEKVEENNG